MTSYKDNLTYTVNKSYHVLAQCGFCEYEWCLHSQYLFVRLGLIKSRVMLDQRDCFAAKRAIIRLINFAGFENGNDVKNNKRRRMSSGRTEVTTWSQY